MAGRSHHVALACALVGGAGCGGASLDPAGGVPHAKEPLWSREFPSTGALPVIGLVSWPSDDFALIGTLYGDSGLTLDGYPLAARNEMPFLARLDGSGNVQRAWFDELPPNGRWQGFAAAADPGGSLYLAGVIVPEPYELALGDYVLRKIRPDGVVAWSKAFALWPGGEIVHLEAAADGVLTVFGAFTGTFDFGGGPIAARNGGQDNFRLRLDSNGAFISAEAFGEPSLPLGFMTRSATGLIGSVTPADGGLWFAQVLDAGGQLIWSHTFSGYENRNGDAKVAFIGDDLIVGTGIADDTDLGDGRFPADVPHLFAVARFDRNGRLVWKRGFGSDYHALLSGLAVDGSGDITLCGFVSHLGDEIFAFDSVSIPWSPPDMFELGFSFIGKLSASGHARWAQKIAGVTTNFYDAPGCAVDAARNVLVADVAARASALYVAKYAR